MLTRFDKAIAAGASAGASLYGYLHFSGNDPHGYGLAACVLIGLGVGIVTYIFPNKAA